MPAAGNYGAGNADKAHAKAKKLKKKEVAARAPGPPNFPKAIPVRPGAATPRPGHEPHKGRQSTQAERTHVHKARVARSKELKKAEAGADFKGASDLGRAKKYNAAHPVVDTSNLKGSLAKKYAKENPDIFKAKSKKELKAAGFSPDLGVKLTTNAYKDLLAIGMTPVSTYHLAEPTGKALGHGDFKKAGKEALKAGKVGFVDPTVETFTHPKKSFMEHPVFTGLQFSGGASAVGRLAGAGGRAGLLGAAGKRAASRERAGRFVPGTNLKEERKYSPDVIRKGVQVANEKRKAANAEFKHRRGGPEPTPATRMHEREVANRMDERISLNEDIRRQNRDTVVKATGKALKGHDHAITSLIAQGIVKPNKADIHAYMKELEAQHSKYSEHALREHAKKKMGATESSKGDLLGKGTKGPHGTIRPKLTEAEIVAHAKAHGVKLRQELSGSEKWANREMRKEIQDALDNPKLDLKGSEKAAKEYAKIVNQGTDALVEHGMLAEEQSLRAKLIPYAVRHMGAKHVHDHYVNAAGKTISEEAYKHLKKDEKTAFKFMPAELRAPEIKDLAFHRSELASAEKDISSLTETLKKYSKEKPGTTHYADLLETKRRLKIAEASIKRHRDAIDGSATRKLSTQEILDHYKANHSQELPAFITHKQRSRGSWNVRSETAPSIGSGRRTGRSVATGTLDPSHAMMLENAAKIQGLQDAAEGFKGIIKETSMKTDKGEAVSFETRKEALKAAEEQRFHPDTGEPIAAAHEMVPVRLNAFNGTKEQLQSMLDDTHGDPMFGTHSPAREAIKVALSTTEGDGPWTLIPKAAQRRINEHLNTMGRTTGEQAVQAVSGAFRKTVLSTSPTWLWGNVSEATLRAAIAGAGPLSHHRAVKVLREIEKNDPALAQEIAHRVAGGGHLSSVERQQIFRTAEQFQGTALESVAKSLATAHRAPIARNIGNAWTQWTSHVFRFNSTLESHFQLAMFGKALKRDGYKAIEDAVNGLHNTESQVRLGRMVDDMYGQYSKWSPTTRYAISTYTPFISWWLAAAKFVGVVLPRDHPVLTGLMASANKATEEWRKENKINLEDLGLKAAFLAGSVPLKGGRHVNIARFTPFGAFTNPLEVMNTILPQISSAVAIAKGSDWKGHDYKSAKEGLKGFGTEMAGAYVPFFQREQAAKKYGVAQSVNPYRPIAPGKKKTAGKPKVFKFDQPSSGGFDWEGGSGSDSGFDWGG